MKLETIYLFFIFIILYLFLILDITAAALNNTSLVAVHLIFRHGDRTPEKSNLYKNSPYYNETYFKPYGFGQLTNKGKLRAFNLGQEIRTRYNGFLDEEYNVNLIDARSSDFNRTKASLQAMLAGLFPPTKELEWLPGFSWQPIATTYVERNSDKELFCFGCATWDARIDKYLDTKEGTAKFTKYKTLIQFLSNQTQEDYDILKSYYLYFGFEILDELNYALPEWAHQVYPYPLRNITQDYYDMITANTILRQMSAGYLLKQILDDTEKKINGKYPDKKMYLWSAHENNIISVLNTLKIDYKHDIVKYGSYLSMEVHYLNGVHGLQILYKNEDGPVTLKLPDCEEFCPLDSFNRLVKRDIPADDRICTGVSSSAGFTEYNKYILVLLVPLFYANMY